MHILNRTVLTCYVLFVAEYAMDSVASYGAGCKIRRLRDAKILRGLFEADRWHRQARKHRFDVCRVHFVSHELMGRAGSVRMRLVSAIG